MTDPLPRYESVVDQQIRLAQERGDFDNLPGMGKPLPGRGEPDDELWWIKGYLRREKVPTEALLPTSLRLARQAERLPEQVRDLPSEAAVRDAVAEHNRQVAEYLRAPSDPPVRVAPVDPDRMVQLWRATRESTVGPDPLAGPPADPPARRRRGWARWFGRRPATGA